MPISQGDLIQLTFVSRWQGQQIMLTHHYKCRTPPSGGVTTATALQAMIDAVSPLIADTLGTAYLDCLPENVVVREVSAQKIYPAREVRQSQAFSSAGTSEGTVADTGNIDGIITLRTDKAGRSQVSNKHIGPLPGNGFANGLVGPTQQVDMETLAQMLIAPLTAAGGGTYDPCIYHRAGDGAAQKSDLITSFKLQDTVRVMRRRTVGLGI